MEATRKTDEKISLLFCSARAFSEHLTRREDPQLPDKYDHNAFSYVGQPTAAEFREALEYQKARGDSYIQLDGYEPLENSFGMEQESTWTMVLPEEVDIGGWKTNPDVVLHMPGAEELEQHELAYYGPLYGDSFTVRNNRRLRQKLSYHGAYLEDRLVGSCYTYTVDGYTCMDSLVVNADYRHRYLATTLLKAIAEAARRKGNLLYLHADADDTPKDMYTRMGFRMMDQQYSYLCTDFSTLKLD